MNVSRKTCLNWNEVDLLPPVKERGISITHKIRIPPGTVIERHTEDVLYTESSGSKKYTDNYPNRTSRVFRHYKVYDHKDCQQDTVLALFSPFDPDCLSTFVSTPVDTFWYLH